MQSNFFINKVLSGVQQRLRKSIHKDYKKAGLNWFKIKFLKHASPGKVRAYNFKGNTIFYQYPVEFLHGLSEIFVEEIYAVNLPAHPFIIDCGANIGLSVIYLKKRFPDAEIIAFEPDEKNFDLLQRNVASFGFNYIHLKKEAVWITDTELSFESKGRMDSRLSTDIKSSAQKVSAIRLKNLLNRKVDFLKIDIEGAEYEVLRDIQDCLHQVDNLFLEYHGLFAQQSQLIEMLNWLCKEGFNFYIKEATQVYKYPMLEFSEVQRDFNIQLNIFCFRVNPE